MNKKKKLYKLKRDLYIESQRVSFLLANIVEETAGNLEAKILADLALEKSQKIEKLSEKIGKIFKY